VTPCDLVPPTRRPVARRAAPSAGDRYPLALYLVASATVGGRGLHSSQGLTLVHFSAQLEPCLTHKNPLHTLNTPYHPLYTGYAIPTRTLYPIKSAQVELKSERV